ncbi:MAG: hypothetical protein WCO33_05165 [bacterium]
MKVLSPKEQKQRYMRMGIAEASIGSMILLGNLIGHQITSTTAVSILTSLIFASISAYLIGKASSIKVDDTSDQKTPTVTSTTEPGK